MRYFSRMDPIKLLEKRLITRTQAELAREIGCSPGCLGDVLSGRRRASKAILEYLGIERVVGYQPIGKAKRDSAPQAK